MVCKALDEASPSELTVALKFYDTVDAAIKQNAQNIQDIYKLYLTITTTLITGSIAASTIGPPSLVLICCITPCISLPFAKWRDVQSREIIDFAEFIRRDFEPYIAERYPGLRSDRLKILSWSNYGSVVNAHKKTIYHESIASILILHFPSVISLAVATYVTALNLFGDHQHMHLAEMIVFLPILLSASIWGLALWVSWARMKNLIKAIIAQAL